MQRCVFNCVIIDYVYKADIKAICSMSVIMDLGLVPVPLPARGSWLFPVEPECHQKQHSATNIVTRQLFIYWRHNQWRRPVNHISTLPLTIRCSMANRSLLSSTISRQLFLLICSGKVGMKHSARSPLTPRTAPSLLLHLIWLSWDGAALGGSRHLLHMPGLSYTPLQVATNWSKARGWLGLPACQLPCHWLAQST